MKIVVLDGFAVNPGDLKWDFIEKFGEVTVYDKTPDDQCAEKCKDANIVFTNRCKITKELLEACPGVKYISALGTGYDMIDVAACTNKGVCVCNVPAYSSDSVAQMTLNHLLALTTNFSGLCNIVKNGNWTGKPGFEYQHVKFTELAGMTVGLIGYGNIGIRVAEICTALKMRVLASTRTHITGSDGIAEFVSLERLASDSDVISLHCPLNSTTKGMINASFIGKMKQGSYIINTSRGAVLNEKDVADALNSGMLAGVGVDVLACEPPSSDNPLLSAKNCIITPHAAWTTVAARKRLLDILEKNLASFISTGHGINEI